MGETNLIKQNLRELQDFLSIKILTIWASEISFLAFLKEKVLFIKILLCISSIQIVFHNLNNPSFWREMQRVVQRMN